MEEFIQAIGPDFFWTSVGLWCICINIVLIVRYVRWRLKA